MGRVNSKSLIGCSGGLGLGAIGKGCFGGKGWGLGRRGDVRVKVIAIVIAAFVLAVLFFGGIPFLIDSAKKVRDILPGFKDNSAVAKVPELIRYDITTGAVQYYTGVEWVDFTMDAGDGNGKYVDLNGKRVYEGEIMNKIEDSYFRSKREGKEFKFVEYRFIPFYVLLESKNVGNKIITRGSVKVKVSKFTGDIYVSIGDYYVSNEVIIYERGGLLGEDDPLINEPHLHEKVRLSAMGWLELVLTNIWEIQFYNLESKNKDSTEVCFEKFDNKYLVVDLSKKVKGEICEISSKNNEQQKKPLEGSESSWGGDEDVEEDYQKIELEEGYSYEEW